MTAMKMHSCLLEVDMYQREPPIPSLSLDTPSHWVL